MSLGNGYEFIAGTTEKIFLSENSYPIEIRFPPLPFNFSIFCSLVVTGETEFFELETKDQQ